MVIYIIHKSYILITRQRIFRFLHIYLLALFSSTRMKNADNLFITELVEKINFAYCGNWRIFRLFFYMLEQWFFNVGETVSYGTFRYFKEAVGLTGALEGQ